MNQGFDWIYLAYQETYWARAGLAVVLAVAVLAAFPMSGLLRSNPVVVGLLIAAFGAVLVFTLTPLRSEFGMLTGCQYAITRPSRSDLTEPTDISMNILLLLPVGVLLTWLRPFVAVLAFAFIALITPFAVEYAQYALPNLARTCSFYDIATNELGLIIGIAIGLVVRAVWSICGGILDWARRR